MDLNLYRRRVVIFCWILWVVFAPSGARLQICCRREGFCLGEVGEVLREMLCIVRGLLIVLYCGTAMVGINSWCRWWGCSGCRSCSVVGLVKVVHDKNSLLPFVVSSSCSLLGISIAVGLNHIKLRLILGHF